MKFISASTAVATRAYTAKRTTETVFRQMFPFVSVVDEQYQYVLGDNQAYARTCNEWAVNAQHDSANTNSIVSTYLAHQTSATYDINDNGRPIDSCVNYVYASPLLSVTKTINDNDVDRYGNNLVQKGQIVRY